MLFNTHDSNWILDLRKSRTNDLLCSLEANHQVNRWLTVIKLMSVFFIQLMPNN